MATNVATLTAKLKADTTDLRRGLGKAEKDVRGFEKQTTQSTKKGAKGFGNMKTAALGFGAAIVAGGAVKVLNDSIEAASNLEESINAVNVTYGDAAEGVHALGRSSVDEFGLSTRAVNDAAVALGAFTLKIDAADPAGAFGNIIQRAGDFASVMNIETSEALDKFRAGLAGESEPLRQFGIDLSAAEVESVALAAGIIEVGEKMTEGEKVQARYLAIMEQTEKTAGDFAATSDGLAGSQKKLSAAWEEAQVVLGEQLAPTLAKALTGLTKLLGGTRAAARNTSTGFDRMQRAFSKVVDVVDIAVGPFENLTDAWTDQQESLFQVNKRLDQYELLLSDGKSEANAFSGAFVDIVRDGDAFEDTLKNLIETTGISNKELETSILFLLENKKEYGLTATEVDNLERELLKLKTATGDAVGPVEDLGAGLGETEENAGAAALAVAKMWRAADRMASPVLRAKDAVKEYNEVLDRIQEDGVVSIEEMDEAIEAHEDVVATKLDVAGGNVQAYGSEWVTVLGDLRSETKTTNLAIGDLDDFIFTEVDRAADSVSQLAERIGQTSFTARVTLDVPSAADFDDALADAVARAKRGGAFAEAGGF